MKITLDYASPEKTCQDIVTAGENLSGELYAAMIEQSDASIALDRAKSVVDLAIRNNGIKLTDLSGYVRAAVEGDPEVAAMQTRLDKATARVAGLRASLENVDRAYGLFKTWMHGQRPIGLNER